jgi:hypothetical protein
MQFERMTQDDIKRLSDAGFLLKPGTCSFVIKKAEECKSKSGNPQMKLEIDATDIEGKTASVFDYIFYSEAAKWKIVSFCKAIGLEDRLLEGSIEPRDLINRKGQFVIAHEEYNGEKKNRVLRYLPLMEKALQQSAEQIAKEFFPDEEIPF